MIGGKKETESDREAEINEITRVFYMRSIGLNFRLILYNT